MIPVLLIAIPLLSGVLSFFIKDAKAARTWSLVASFATLAVTLIGLARPGAGLFLLTMGLLLAAEHT